MRPSAYSVLRVLLRTGDERGVALFLVLWVLVLLSVIVAEFCHTMRAEVNMTWGFTQGTRAYYVAHAGIQQAVDHMVREGFVPVRREVESEQSEREGPLFRINCENPKVLFGEGYYVVHVANEAGKIDINTADSMLLTIMLSPFQLDEQETAVIVDSILDWRDQDQLHRLHGAENDYYQALPTPYQCKDDYFDSVEELLLVRGITREIFYSGLRDMVTVYGEATEGLRAGKSVPRTKVKPQRININAAPPQVLGALPGMTGDAVKAISAFREEKDFFSLAELITVVGTEIYASIVPYITIELSPYYVIRSKGAINQGPATRTLSALVMLDTRASDRYAVLQWWDDQRPGAAFLEGEGPGVEEIGSERRL
jgi:general secretion pathway protein K